VTTDQAVSRITLQGMSERRTAMMAAWVKERRSLVD
jgi:hypothetical protein